MGYLLGNTVGTTDGVTLHNKVKDEYLTKSLSYLGLLTIAGPSARVAASTFFTLSLCNFMVFFTLAESETCSSASCSRSSNTWNALTNEPRIPVNKEVSQSKNRVRMSE